MKKNNVNITYNWLLIILISTLIMSCSKRDDFLSKSPSSSLIIPTTLSDFQALMDSYSFGGNSGMNTTPALGEASSDDYYMTYNLWQTTSIRSANAYIWAPDIYAGTGNIPDWNVPYNQVFTANIVLEGLDKINVDASNQSSWNTLKGSAYFYRAHAFYNVATIFAPTYDSSTASTDLGIPLRLSSDFNLPSNRSTVQQTYDQILSDLKVARKLLTIPVQVNNLNRPSLPAVYALMARVYLSIRNYSKAGLYADSCLQLYNTLIDYNTLPMSSANYRPFTFTTPESIFTTSQSTSSVSLTTIITGINNQISIDTNLYRSYNVNDLRRTILFYVFPNGAININGSYSGSFVCYSGLAVDEIYLIRAECYARAGSINAAMTDLNNLLRTRWKKNPTTGLTTYVDMTATSVQDALNKILIERRKELVMRGLRWTDLRRLNKEGYNIILTRVLNGQTYTLPPNSPLYVLPIPPDVIQLTGIPQNPR